MIPILAFVGIALLQVVHMGQLPIENGQLLDLADKTTISVETGYDRMALRRVVLVGESHDDPGHHGVQLAIIKAMHSRRGNMAIGLEMIPRNLQGQLDGWIAGEYTEDEFLDAVEWYTTWGFDSELYMPILRFARENGIPLLALNVKREIVHEVRMRGVAGVADSIREELPPMAEASPAYRKHLQEVFDSHPMMSRMGKFDRFVAAQLVWDGAMAQRIARWVADNPDGLLVGLAGSGHISHGYGIPCKTRGCLTLSPSCPGPSATGWSIRMPPTMPGGCRRRSRRRCASECFWTRLTGR